MLDQNTIYALAAVAIFLVVGFPVHEFAHAFAAYRLGDSTARLFGRLTLNPIVHLDPIGALVLVASALLGSGFFIGWAKPTPVNPAMLRGGRRSDALVAAAGPVSNLLMAAAAAIVLRILVAVVDVPSEPVAFAANVLLFFVYINVALFIFNLVPIPPLDGSHVLFAFLDPRTVWKVRPFLQQWGLVILLVAMLLPIGGQSLGGRVIRPLMDGIATLLVGF
ncbi:MAG: site-2 protease family protein [Chloroflexota bacterium]